MARLPTPGGDDGSWGSILNDFLEQSHNNDGTLKSGAIPDGSVTSAKLDAGAVTNSRLASGSVTTSKLADGTITEAKLDGAVQTKLNAVGGGDPAVGGDLSGTASNAQIVAGAVGGTELANSAVTDAKVAAGANIAQSKIANLTTDLAGKADTSHTHAITDVTNLQTSLAGKVDDSITVSGGTSLTGGGDLTTNRTLTLVNDAATPGNSQYYGTDGSGTKGYFALPSGGASQIDDLSDVDTSTTPPSDGQSLVWNNTAGEWQPGDPVASGYIEGDGIAKVTVGNTAPSGPAVGDVWIQTA